MRELSTERVFLVHPYDDGHMQMIKDFENSHSCFGKWTNQLEILRSSLSKEEYDKEKLQKNEIDEILCCERGSKILGICHVHGEKDIRLAKIHIVSASGKSQKMIPEILDFVFRQWQIEEIFMMVHPEDRDTIHYLMSQNYEDLGEESGERLYLVEREMMNHHQRAM